MFKKSDQKFEAIAADPERRREAIADLSLRRLIVAIGLLFSFVCVIGSSWSGKESPSTFFAAAIFFTILTRTESDLRLLRVIDRLDKSSGAHPAAKPE